MKKVTYLLPVACLALIAYLFLTSSTVTERSNHQVIAELSADLADMKDELKSLKNIEKGEDVSNDPFIGEVILFAGNFAPRGWAFCEGQLLSISQYQALFSILGTMYGGDGRTTFALPDLRGRVPVGVGSGPRLSQVIQGAKYGVENVTLTQNNLPSHNHNYGGSTIPGFELDPTKTSELYIKGAKSFVTVGNEANSQLSGSGGNNVGGGQSFSVRNPSLGLRYIIALQGTYPSRS